MQTGTIDLAILILIFLGLQVWWITSIIKKNISLNKRSYVLREQMQKLEKIYKK